MQAIDRLASVSRTFGAAAASEKLDLLQVVLDARRLPARDLRSLHDLLCFLRAFPDDARVLRRVVELIGQLRARVATLPDGEQTPSLADDGFPGAVNHHVFSYPTVRRMLAAVPGCFEVDLDELEDQRALHNALVLFMTNNENQGLDDIGLTFGEWLDRARPSGSCSRLAFLVQLFEGSDLGEEARAYVYDACGIPIHYRLATPGTGRAELSWPARRVHFQRQALDRSLPRLAQQIQRPLGPLPLLPPADGDRLIDLAHAALCSRNLEIAPLMYANRDDVTLIACGRGLQLALVGVVPDYRDTLESAYFFLVLKNGVPLGYGPASVCLGCCEMGINLFPEFRGAEIRTIYAQFMRCLHHALGVRYFSLTSYGMGEGNPAAIASGAFWFYRKLGFRADDPAVEELARAEEDRMHRDPGHRSDRAMLRRLSHTGASFDLSGGACRPLDLGAIGIRQSGFIGERFGGDRRVALRRCGARLRRLLGITDHRSWSPARRRALELYAPLLCMIDDLETWSARDRRGLLRIIESKAARSERAVDGLVSGHARLREALRSLALPRD